MMASLYPGADHHGGEIGGNQDVVNQLMAIFQSIELFQHWKVCMSVTLGQSSDKVRAFSMSLADYHTHLFF